VVLAWCIGIFAVLRRIHYAARWSGGVLAVPLQLLTICFFAGLAVRLSHRIIDRLSTNWQAQEVIEFLNLGDAQRRKLRISTIAGATKGLITILILVIAILSVLTTVGVPAGSVLAIGGLFGFALSFGSQNLVKDFVNSFLILAEDQYAIGDVIDVGSASGLVENLNLRVTQSRKADGELVMIPNSAITEVKNLTQSWSRVNFSIDLQMQTPLPRRDSYKEKCWGRKNFSCTIHSIIGAKLRSQSTLTATVPKKHPRVGMLHFGL